MTSIRLASRKSPLALWQTRHVAEQIEQLHPKIKVDIVGITTLGDKRLSKPLLDIGGKGLFLKELEEALLVGRCDAAVHSMKDVPGELPAGLHIGAILERACPLDALVSIDAESLAALPVGAKVGTGSLRRQSQLLAVRPDLNVIPIRGNVETRLRKCDDGELDAVILAAAGLRRLGLGHRITALLASETCLPAIGQGAIGVEWRLDDARMHALLAPLNHAPSSACLQAERALGEALNASCHVPIGGLAEIKGETIHMRGLVASPDGGQCLSADANGPRAQAKQLGQSVADDLIAQGADRLIAALL